MNIKKPGQLVIFTSPMITDAHLTSIKANRMSSLCLKVGVDISAEDAAEIMATQTGLRAISPFNLDHGQVFPQKGAPQKKVTADDLSKLDSAEIFMASIASDRLVFLKGIAK